MTGTLRTARAVGFVAAAAVAFSAGCGAGGGGGGTGGTGGTTGGNGGNGTVNGLTADPSLTDLSVSLLAGRQTAVELNAGASSSAASQIVSYQWFDRFCDQIGTGVNAEVLLGAGEHHLRLAVTDSSGATAENNFVLTVMDERPSQVTLTTSVEGSGRTEPAAGDATTHSLDSTTTVTAIADDGWQFSHWEGDSEAESASIPVVMDQDKSLAAVFQEIPEGDVPRFYVPWGVGESRTTGQANNGEFSHQDPETGEPRYAWDYTIDIGTPILAVEAGRVVQIVSDVPNNAEGETGSIESPANLVQIDHGNGFQSLYAHLDQFGVAVEPGQLVYRGQYLGRSGNSGYATGPHLHYEMLDPTGGSASTGFVESSRDGGVSQELDPVTSQNALDPSSLEDFVESAMLTDAFLENNIELIEPTPPAFFFNADQTYAISGRVTDGRARNVCVALVLAADDNPDDVDATVFCEAQPVGVDDTFSFDFTFPRELVGSYLLGVVSGVGPPAGVARINALVLPPKPTNQAPTVTVTQPVDDTIDFGGAGTLSASAGDADGDTLTYFWAQTSGPPATIADPTAAETEFTLGEGQGITRVAFQVIVSDGIDTSEPAEVVYRMPDNFLVREMGVMDVACSGPDECEAAAGDTLSASRDRFTVWVELLNLNQGDFQSFEIRNPAGELVLEGRLCDPAEQTLQASFWQFGWSGNRISDEPGDWRAVYLRNGVEEGSAAFTLAP
ncbi:MAG TPA: peptidoglycan DD-metalloendopeptidase family protein [Phycisphaerae bacterium]|nr:peptidoglycan DD-metalloendopeptidase family protein [Phycisphaerae bacterium]